MIRVLEKGAHSQWPLFFRLDGKPFPAVNKFTMANAISFGSRYEQVTNALPQLIWETDAKGDAIVCNKSWFEYTGFTAEQSRGKGWMSILHPDDAHLMATWPETNALNSTISRKASLRKYDGSFQMHDIRIIRLTDENQQTKGWVCIAELSTETEDELQKRSALLQTIFETAVDFAIITLDENGLIVDWNSGAENLFGYTREEALGQHSEIIFTEEDRLGGIPAAEMRMARETGHAKDERWHLRKDGSRFFMSGVMSPMTGNTIKGFVKITRDITDRKLSEEALLLTEQTKTLALQGGRMGEWSLDVVTQVFEGNEQCSRIIGLEPAKRKISVEEGTSLVHPDDRDVVVEALGTALKGLNIFHTECRIIDSATGGYRWISCYGRVIAHEKDEPVRMIGVMYDITDRKQLERQKEDFISIASHELRSPVTSIKAYTELLHENLAKGTDHLKSIELTGKLGTQVERLKKLIYSLLDYSNLGELRMRLFPERFDINQLISEVISGFQANPSKHYITWKPHPTAEVHADRDRIRQVVDNLLTNAIKYSPAASEIIVTTRDQLDHVEVSIRDFGPGIPLDVQARVFERFFRVSDHVQQHNHGLGLGLYISSEIIRHHFGTIHVENGPGGGSVFIFTLPYS